MFSVGTFYIFSGIAETMARLISVCSRELVYICVCTMVHQYWKPWHGIVWFYC